jgi:hypothetical protein
MPGGPWGLGTLGPWGLGALGVLAFGDLADPIGRVARHARYVDGGVPLTQQPENLPPRAFVGVVGAPLPAFELSHAQMRLEMKMSWHTDTLQLPTPFPYDIPKLAVAG